MGGGPSQIAKRTHKGGHGSAQRDLTEFAYVSGCLTLLGESTWLFLITTTSALGCKAPTNVIKHMLRIRFDFAMLLFETLRHGLSWMPLQNWLFVDTVSLVQAVGLANLGGCAKEPVVFN